MIGKVVSHYRILERLGGGGMGVVYKAEDTRLKRMVALKFLPSDLTRDPLARERFTHEAQAASALQHNNICVVHDIDQAPDGQLFIVMESLDGPSLKERIAQGPLKTEEVLAIAMQVAEGLSKAHAHAIVHRDVKPANIMLCGDGVVKIVDFGLAKLKGQTVLTKTGSTLGTVTYMAPEQVRGEPADHRSDIWALGVVIYEMVTGRQPFRGEHESAVAYGILNTEPEPFSSLRSGVPLDLERIVTKALSKNPRERYQHVDELLVDLRKVKKDTGGIGVVTDRIREGNRTRRSVVVLAGLILLGVVVSVAVMMLPKKKLGLNPQATTLVLPAPSRGVCSGTGISLSSDGKWVVFGAHDSRIRWDVYIMNTSGGEAKRVTFDSAMGKEGSVALSEDGAFIAYQIVNRLTGAMEICAVPTLGGPRRVVATRGWYPRWIPSKRRIAFLMGGPVASQSGKYEIWSVQPDGTDLRMEYVDTVGSLGSMAYAWSPSGESFAFLRGGPDNKQVIFVHDCGSGRDRQVTFDRVYIDIMFWTSQNDLIYSSTKSGNMELWSVPVEGGESIQLTRGAANANYGHVSSDGKTLAYLQGEVAAQIKIGSLESGRIEQLTADDHWRGGVGIAPDSRYLGYVERLRPDQYFGNDVIAMDRVERRTWHVASGRGTIRDPVMWSPDSKKIAYTTQGDSVGSVPVVCVVPVFETVSPTYIGEGSSPRWFDENTVGWYSRGKTWCSAITKVEPRQFYRDSTSARPIFSRKQILFRDMRQGFGACLWLDLALGAKPGGRNLMRKVGREGDFFTIDPTTRVVLASRKRGLFSPIRITLPDCREEQLPFEFPEVNYVGVTSDGKEIAYTTFETLGKIVVVHDPFLR